MFNIITNFFNGEKQIIIFVHLSPHKRSPFTQIFELYHVVSKPKNYTNFKNSTTYIRRCCPFVIYIGNISDTKNMIAYIIVSDKLLYTLFKIFNICCATGLVISKSFFFLKHRVKTSVFSTVSLCIYISVVMV